MKHSVLIGAFGFAVWLGTLMAACTAGAQDFTIVILDDPGVGFLDPTQRISDIDGQMTTLGEDRVDCFIAALTVWANHLDISTTIMVDAAFESLGGDEHGAILAGANPKWVFRDFFDAPVSDTWFAVAEANQIAGIDLDPDPQRFPSTWFDDIDAAFNLDVDETCETCALGATTWYYGIDGDPPEGKIDFFSTAMHEMAHGLGFASWMNLETLPGIPYVVLPVEAGSLHKELNDIFTSQLRREGDVNMNYTDMTNEERAAANISGEVVWKGAAVVAFQGAPEPIYAPDPVLVGSSILHWAPTVIPNPSPDPEDPPFVDDPDQHNLLMEPFKTDPLASLTLVRIAFEDLFWPLIPFDRDNVYVDFAFTGWGFGTQAAPITTAATALRVANPGANIWFAAGTTSEAGTFSTPSLWQSTGGTVIFGVP